MIAATAAVMLFGPEASLTGYDRAQASSHREAPLISQDPAADLTDVYAFVSPDKPTTVTLIANWWPMCEPAGGPNFCLFDDQVQYDVWIDNNGDAVADIQYSWRFTTTRQTGDTFLQNTGAVRSPTDANQNVRQTYTLTRTAGGTTTTLGSGLITAPANVGPRSFPDGYEAVAMQAVKDLGSGYVSFSGPRDDPFFVDLGGIFDLLGVRKLPGNAGGGVDNVNGYNILTTALQVPITQLTSGGTMPAGPSASNAVIGVWATASRPATRTYTAGGQTTSGSMVQISRLGMPLVNEVVIPLKLKDAFNNLRPDQDAGALSQPDPGNGVTIPLVQDPELGRLLKSVLGVDVPPPPRNDLVQVFLTGVPGLNQPPGVKASEMLRLNVAIAPTASPNRLGVIAGDNGGFPNGRRLADDIVDISLRVVGGVLVSGFDKAPNNQLGDGVDGNDAPFKTTFPYMAPPWSGFNSPHGTSLAGGSPVVPELPVQLMFGSGLAGLGGYALLQARAMRRKIAK
jgi:hypothetical protein